MVQVGVHACTDVTGFGLLGHLRGLAGASDVGARIHAERVPVLAGAWDLARQGVIPAGSRNNRQFATDFVTWGPEVAQETQAILTDAQTSGGLLIAVPGERKAALLAALKAVDAPVAAEIGEIVEDGEGRVRVE
jgi:selenide,water dikinase